MYSPDEEWLGSVVDVPARAACVARAAARAVSMVPLVLGALVATSSATLAAPITDAINDFVPSFLGPHNADLDVVSAEVFLDPNNFILHAVLHAVVGRPREVTATAWGLALRTAPAGTPWSAS